MGPLELVRLVIRFFRIDSIQALGGAAAVGFCAYGFMYNVSEDTAAFGLPDKWDGNFLLFSLLASCILGNLARQGAGRIAPDDEEERRKHLRPFLIAAATVHILAAVFAAIVIVLFRPSYVAAVQTVLPLETAAAILMGIGFWFGDRLRKPSS